MAVVLLILFICCVCCAAIGLGAIGFDFLVPPPSTPPTTNSPTPTPTPTPSPTPTSSPTPAPDPYDGKIFTLRNQGTTQCVYGDFRGSSVLASNGGSDGGVCTATPEQTFKMVRVGDKYMFVCQATFPALGNGPFCLDGNGGSGYGSSYLSPCDSGNGYQHWVPPSTANNQTLQHPQTGNDSCLGSLDTASTAYSYYVFASCSTNTAYFKWTLHQV